MARIRLAILIALLAAGTTTARIITVDNDAPADFNNIQAAINNATDRDTVEIQPGTYTGPGNQDIDFKGKAITVRSTNPEDPAVVAATVIDCNGAPTAFIFQTREQADSILAGLTVTRTVNQGVLCERASPLIQNCRFVKNSGTGMDTYDSAPTITNCEFIDNSSYRGGAIENHSGTLTITGCTFIGNIAQDYGGAIAFAYNAVIANCIFEGNFARRGGALYSVSGSTISDCIFTGNGGGGSAISGGGAAIDRCTFNANIGTAITVAGGRTSAASCIFTDTKGSAVFAEGQAYLTFDNCIFRNNASSAYGGAFMIWPLSRLTLSNSILIGNSALEDGGAISCKQATATIVNCIFASNTAGHRGGAIFLNDECFLTMTNSTLTANSAGIGAALACHFFGTGTQPNRAIIANSILWDGHEPIRDFYGGSIIEVSFSNVEGGYDGEGNISVDPSFALGTDFHLTQDSPCLDAGSNGISDLPSTDIDGNLRILDAGLDRGPVVDMGAYEYDPDRPSIAISADRITFVHNWPEPEEQTRHIQIRNCGGQPLNWRIEYDCDWLTVTPSSGLSTDNIDQLTITLLPLDLQPGFYTSVVSVIDETAANSPVNISISLHVPDTLYVPAEHPTIQDAIDIASDYDVIIVADGIYSGEGNRSIDYIGKPLVIMSENGPEHCIVDCNGAQYERFNGFVFLDGEDTNSVLDGFTITNAGEHAIYCYRAGATIRNCIMSNGANSAIRAFRESDLSVTNCIISGNAATDGGAINTYSSDAVLSNCLIYNNTATDEGGAIYVHGGSTTLTNCTITGNSTTGIGGGIRAEFYNESILSNCIVHDNPTSSGSHIAVDGWSELEATYSNIEGGWSGPGNIDGNSLFVNPADGDFHLSLDSPCIDAGDPNYVPFPGQTDIDGEPRILNGRIEMGADELPYDGPLIAVWPVTLEFFAYEAGSNPSTQALSVFYKGLPGLGWEVTEDCNWLQVAALPQSEPNDLEVIVDVSGMPGGYYHCGLIITDPAAENSPRTVPVDLHVLGPVMEVSATQVEFFAERGGPNPQDQSFTVQNSGGGTLSWAITYVGDCSWLEAAPTAGESVGEIDDIILSVEVSELTAGSYTCSLEVSDPNSANGLQTVTVLLHIFDQTIHVPLQFPTIQGGIDHVLEGGIVIVADGIYTGDGNRDIDFKGKAITVRSENGPESCIIDCGGLRGPTEWEEHRGFYFHSGEDGNSVLSGFTITNGWISGACGYGSGGGAIMCTFSSPTISNCIFRNNTCTTACIVWGSTGGAIYLEESHSIINNCIIVGNTAYEGAGGIHCQPNSNPIIANCTICDNHGFGILAIGLVVTNSILWGNASGYLWDDFSDQLNANRGNAIVNFSDIQGDWLGLGNIDGDPCFVSPGYWDPNDSPWDAKYIWVGADYHLKSEGWRWDTQRGVWTWDDLTSRCIDAGDPDSSLDAEPLSIPLDPNNDWGQNHRINMGAYGGTDQASIGPNGWSGRKDYNNDGITNFTDFACWSDNYVYSHGKRIRRNADANDLALLAHCWLDRTTWFEAPASVPPHLPGKATDPYPTDGATGVSIYTGDLTYRVLTWRADLYAASHDVYFGKRNPPPFLQNQTESWIYFTEWLEAGTTYYWRIDERNGLGTTTGDLWTFTTED